MSIEKILESQVSIFTEHCRFNEETVVSQDIDWPKLTIVTPCLNQAQYIEKAIISVLNQNYPNLEYIVLDGGSTDGTLSILEKYKGYLSYWRSSPDNGQADALKEGFNRATGEILAWLNSDDVYLPGVFKHIAKVMREDKGVDVCYGNMCIIDEQGQVVAERRLTSCPSFLMNLGFRHGGFGVYQPASFWRRGIYDAVGGVDASLHFDMDNDLFMRFIFTKSRFEFVPRTLVAFRVHEGSKSFALKTDHSKSEIPILAQRYCLPPRSVRSSFIRGILRLYRIWRHIIQGDIAYLFKRLGPNPWSWVA